MNIDEAKTKVSKPGEIVEYTPIRFSRKLFSIKWINKLRFKFKVFIVNMKIRPYYKNKNIDEIEKQVTKNRIEERDYIYENK